MEVGPGTLLVATPAIEDPNFSRTVVMMLEVTEEGAMGVILNRPSDTGIPAVLRDWTPLVNSPSVVFEGGPVEPTGAVGVGLLRPNEQPPLGWTPVLDTLGMVDLGVPVELVGSSVQQVRLFGGYAGWGVEQLRGEIHQGSWYIVPGVPEDVFRSSTQSLWADVLKRQPGRLAWYVTRPMNAELN